MPEPLTTLWRCPEPSCGLLGDEGTYCCGRGDGHHTRARRLEPVFSAGDMQAALDESARLRIQRDGFSDESSRRGEALGDLIDAARSFSTAADYKIEAGAEEDFIISLEEAEAVFKSIVPVQSREVELAEALRDLDSAARGVEPLLASYAANSPAHEALLDATEKARAALGDTPPSLEVVPLGTQEAARELLNALAVPLGPVTTTTEDETRLHTAAQRVHALVEGVERTPTPSGLRDDPSFVLAKYDDAKEILDDLNAYGDAYKLPEDLRQSIRDWHDETFMDRCTTLGPDCGCNGPRTHAPTTVLVPVEHLTKGVAALRSYSSGRVSLGEGSRAAIAGTADALAAALELQAGERTHTLVPNRWLLVAADAADGVVSLTTAGERDWPWAELARAFRAAARGDRSVRWPGDDTAGQEASSDVA